jgi:V/A-type H+-transporting ATPase subunit C
MHRTDAYVHTRVSIMARQLLTHDQVAAMLALPPADQQQILHNARLDALHLDETPAPSAAIEQRIISAILADVLVLVRPLVGGDRDFLLHWVHRTELSNLKAILRGKLAGRSAHAIRDDLVDMGPFVTLPVDSLLHTEDFTELLLQLEDTLYGDIARQVRAVFETQHDLFAVDATVDRRYFTRLVTRAKTLETLHGRLFRELVASIVDRVNLIWLLRYRFVYQLPPAQAFYLLVPSPYRLSTERLATLAKLGRIEDVVDALPEMLRTRVAGAHNPFEITQRMEMGTWDAAHRALNQSSSALGRAFAYLVLREMDLRKVRAIHRAQALELGPELTRQALGLSH